MHIRQAEEADVTGLVALVNAAYRGDSARRGWTHEADLLDGQRTDATMVRALLAARPGAILVLPDTSGALSGCVAVAPTAAPDIWSAGMLTVAPTLQAAGLGRTLLTAAERVAASHGARTMTLTVLAARAALIAYYERRGYAATGAAEPFPYGDARFGAPRTDTLHFIVMAKPLDGASTVASTRSVAEE